MYELPPGEAIGPYHYENPEEEWLLVLSGRPTLRHPEGEDERAPWDVVFFPRGPVARTRCATDGRLGATRVLMFSNRTRGRDRLPGQREDPEIWTGSDDDDIIVRRTSGVDYWRRRGLTRHKDGPRAVEPDIECGDLPRNDRTGAVECRGAC